MKRTLLTLLITALVWGLAFAQSPLNPAARESLRQAERLVSEAQATYIEHYPDKPLWRGAIALAQEARRQDPNHLAPLRFMAEVYSLTNWLAPAWDAWQDYLRAGGSLDAEAQQMLAEVGTELAYLRYSTGDLTGALDLYQRVIDLAPDTLEAYVWSGRILTELEQPAQAISYWQAVVERDPGDERAVYFLDLVREQARFGVEAVNAFHAGVAFYEQGNLSSARERFARATQKNPLYAEAWAWLGRVAFDTARYSDATTFYGRASQLAPGNATYLYFFEESQRRAG